MIPSDTSAPPSPPEDSGQTTDLSGGQQTLGEVDYEEAFDNDEEIYRNGSYAPYPVKPKHSLSLKKSLLGETSPGPNYVARELKNKPRRKNPLNQDTDHAKLVSHSKSKQSDSISHPFGNKQDLINPFKNPMSENDDDDVDEYLDQRQIFGDMRLSEIESIVKKLKNANRKISESENTSGDEDES